MLVNANKNENTKTAKNENLNTDIFSLEIKKAIIVKIASIFIFDIEAPKTSKIPSIAKNILLFLYSKIDLFIFDFYIF